MTSIEWASLEAIRARAKAYAEHGTPGLAAPKDRAHLLGIVERVEAQVAATEELAEIVVGEDLQAGLRMVARGIRAAITGEGGA